MGRFLVLVTVSLVGVLCTAESREPELNYWISFDQMAADPQLDIRLEVQGEADGTTKLLLPHAWAGQEGFEKGISEITLLNPGAKLKVRSPESIEIFHEPSEPLRLTYTVRQAWQESIATGGFYWPLINKEYVHFFGYGVFVVPDWKDAADKSVVIHWQNLPQDWTLANSHGAGEDLRAQLIPFGNLQHAVYVAGAFRLYRIEVKSQPIYIAIEGQWKFEVTDLIEMTRKIFEGQREFFKDYDYPYYLISLISVPSASCCSLSGTGLIDSFAMAVSSTVEDVNMFKHLLSHELFHNWNGRKIKRVQPEQLQYWFSEGFTEYYAYRLNLRYGLIDLPEYLYALNRKIYIYMSSPARNATNSRILEEFWSNQHVQDIPYLRGEMLAHRWNTKIKLLDPKRSIDDFMRDLLEEAESKGVKVDPRVVDRLIKTYLPEGIGSDLAEVVERGDTVEFLPQAMGPCVDMKMADMPTYDSGFDDVSSAQSGIVHGVRTGGPAAKAGLRNGQRLIEFRGDPSRPYREVTAKVQGEGTKEVLVVKYLPTGEPAPVPQYQLDLSQFENSAEKCMAWFR